MRKTINNGQSFHEEIANSITHGIGLLMAIVGVAFLIYYARQYGNDRRVVCFSVYGVTLIVLYAASMLYHGFPRGRKKHILRIIDHSAIYFLIAGSYTPFALITIKGSWGWGMFFVLWSLAFLGTAFKIFFVNRFLVLSTIIYLLMGWAAVIVIRPLLNNLPVEGLLWLLASGLFYSLGIFFHLLKNIPYTHAAWHIFVLGGSICHYFAVFFYVLPMK